MAIIKKEVASKPTPEQLKEGYREWTPENDRKFCKKRAEESDVIHDGDSRSIRLQKMLEYEDFNRANE